MAEANYINAIFIKKVGQHGNLAVSIKVDDFIEELQKIKKKTGWANLVVKERRQPSEKGFTHYVVEDTWQPQQQQSTEDRVEIPQDKDSDSLPF